MVKIIFVSSSGERREVEAQPGMTVMETATKGGIDEIVAECGGACACATCHVYVAPEWFDKLPPAGPMESDMLDFAVDPRPNSRLSCQIRIEQEFDGLIVETPAQQG
jgi:2Fe-2S ferredoxin